MNRKTFILFFFFPCVAFTHPVFEDHPFFAAEAGDVQNPRQTETKTTLSVVAEGLSLDEALRLSKVLKRKDLTPFISKHKKNFAISVPLAQTAAADRFILQEKEKTKQEALEITPSSRGCPANQSGLILSAKFLYWNPRQDNLALTVDFGIEVNSPPSIVPDKLVLISQKFPWSPGIRIDLGYNSPYNGWDLVGEWTYLSARRTMKVSSDTQSLLLLLATPGQSPINNAGTGVKSTWTFTLQMVDLLLGREFLISKKLSLKPIVGLKTAWPYQHWYVNYIGTTPDPLNIAPNTIRSTNRFWGIGPRTGVLSRWKLPADFRIDFDFTSSLLFSKFRSKAVYSDFRGGSNPHPDLNLPLINKINGVVPQIQLGIGIDWSSCYGKNRYFEIYAGYEFEYWWNEFKVAMLSNIQPAEDLMIQGLVSGFRLDF